MKVEEVSAAIKTAASFKDNQNCPFSQMMGMFKCHDFACRLTEHI